ncbi:MAG: hypothetical protein RSG22_14675 [Comamonas sp.]
MPMSLSNRYPSGDRAYLEALQAEADLLMKEQPEEGTSKHARLAVLLAKIEQLTNPITVPGWDFPEDM